MKFEMPNVGEWNAIEADYPVEALQPEVDDFDFFLDDGSFDRFADKVALPHLVNDLSNRLIQARWSWVIMMHCFKKGIPDDRYFAGGKSGGLEYYPDFDKDAHMRKAQFDYFSDIFFFKMYSSLDTLGLILNSIYHLELKPKRRDFFTAVGKLDVRPELQAKLKTILEADDFETLRQLRHDTTHNEIPGHVGSMVHKVTEGYFTLGAGAYTGSKEIVRIANVGVQTLVNVLATVKEQIKLETITPLVI